MAGSSAQSRVEQKMLGINSQIGIQRLSVLS
jgi:hypothetical protein